MGIYKNENNNNKNNLNNMYQEQIYDPNNYDNNEEQLINYENQNDENFQENVNKKIIIIIKQMIIQINLYIKKKIINKIKSQKKK